MKLVRNYIGVYNKYRDRQTKAKYVWLKYHSILRGRRILDIGADKCYLKQHLDEEASYWGIGFGGGPDQEVNLEQGKIPFPEHSFDCILCLDVLEHLEQIHQIFDECCRVTHQHVIISLPNPLGILYSRLRFGDYRPGQFTKFYGLPFEPPPDRHRWFFSYEEAEKFILYRGGLKGMRVLQMEPEGMGGEPTRLKRLARMVLFRKDLNPKNLYAGTLWAVLEKIGHD
ncbi:MAG: methyltransferase domain-containing protein [Deltaproteobacteria bacterium]|nr:methyltransferase domain-containing protein [Deltaproteobacteria bacterium]MBW1795966.1 methyltransferase domain-containing protein [Deltaproteobacteria bacterium]